MAIVQARGEHLFRIGRPFGFHRHLPFPGAQSRNVGCLPVAVVEPVTVVRFAVVGQRGPLAGRKIEQVQVGFLGVDGQPLVGGDEQPGFRHVFFARRATDGFGERAAHRLFVDGELDCPAVLLETELRERQFVRIDFGACPRFVAAVGFLGAGFGIPGLPVRTGKTRLHQRRGNRRMIESRALFPAGGIHLRELMPLLRLPQVPEAVFLADPMHLGQQVPDTGIGRRVKRKHPAFRPRIVVCRDLRHDGGRRAERSRCGDEPAQGEPAQSEGHIVLPCSNPMRLINGRNCLLLPQ